MTSFLCSLILFIFLLIIPIIYIISLSNYNLILKVPYNFSKITIKRDKNAIPHIYSDSLESAYFAIGYTQAQDRLFQMQMNRIFMSGRMSEYFGPSFLTYDKFIRSLGVGFRALLTKKNLSKDLLKKLKNYADGVNYFMKESKFLPIQFWFSGFGLYSSNIEEWTIEDSLIIDKFMELRLISEWQYKLIYDKLLNFYDVEILDELMTIKSEFAFKEVNILNDEDLKQSLIYSHYNSSKYNSEKNSNLNQKHDFDLREIYDLIENTGKGSNSWVIHGNYTSTGFPILANDPHLDNTIPSFWYQYTVDYLKKDRKKFLNGATLPGIPFLLIGETDYLAWGFTTQRSDDSDLYREILNKEENKYFYDDKYHDLEIRKEIISIKGMNKTEFIVKSTRNGPILDNIIDPFYFNKGFISSEYRYSIALPAFANNNSLYTFLDKFMDLDSFDELKKTLLIHVHYSQHLIYATKDNHIGYLALGNHFLHNNPEKYGSLNGSISHESWIGIIKDSKRPQVIDPKKGYIVTANNRFGSDNYIGRTTLHLVSTARAVRITEMIENLIKNNKKISVEDVKKMQFDIKDCHIELIMNDLIFIVEYYLEFWNFDQRIIIKELINYLKNWDFNMDKNKIEPSIYMVWETIFINKILSKIKDENYLKIKLISSVKFDQFIFRKIKFWAESIRKKTYFFDKKLCSIEKNSDFYNLGCIYHLIQSFIETKEYLLNLNKNKKFWNWGTLHKMLYKNMIFDNNFMRFFAVRKFESDGNRRTVNVAVEKIENFDFNSIHSANYRLISSLSEKEKSIFMIDTGVSENFMSNYYDDQMLNNMNKKYIEIRNEDFEYYTEIIGI